MNINQVFEYKTWENVDGWELQFEETAWKFDNSFSEQAL